MDEDVDWDAVWGRSGSEADEWESGGNYGDDIKELLDAEETEDV